MDIIARIQEELEVTEKRQHKGWGFTQSVLQDAIREIKQLRERLSTANHAAAADRTMSIFDILSPIDDALVLQVVTRRGDGCYVIVEPSELGFGLNVTMTSQTGNHVDSDTIESSSLHKWIADRKDY